MHSQRFLVAAIAIPLFVALTLYAPAWTFMTLIAMGSMFALHEWAEVTGEKRWPPRRGYPVELAGAALFAAAAFGGERWLVPAFFAALVFLLASALARKDMPVEARLQSLALSFLGAAYVGIGLGVQIPIRMREDGVALILFLYLVTAAGDIGAYYLGKAVGRHKMAPAVSPGKTWEGSAGHVLASLGAAALAKGWFCGAFAWWEIFALGVLLSAAGQLGDLSISLLKRACGVKDTGTLLPGHGGVLDRADAFLLTGPALYAWLTLPG
jgi:phosphatidate cytidylyltransferase